MLANKDVDITILIYTRKLMKIIKIDKKVKAINNQIEMEKHKISEK